MATTITLKHYSDTNTLADTSITLATSNANGRVIGVRTPKSVGWTSVFHSFEVTVNADTDMVGCELLALGLYVKAVREDLL